MLSYIFYFIIDSKASENDDFKDILQKDIDEGDVYQQSGLTNEQRWEVLNTHGGWTSTQGLNVTEKVKVRLRKYDGHLEGHSEHKTIQRIS